MELNKKLSERRAAMIKQYLVENFHLSAGNLRTIGYGKTRPKNPSDLNARRPRLRARTGVQTDVDRRLHDPR